MREILFRGKRLDNDEWVEGHLLWYEDGRAKITPRHTDIFVNQESEIDIYHIAYEVDPDTVCEYTGLTDKNGKIFEGDIATVYVDYGVDPIFKKNKGDMGVVRWDNELSRYYIKGKRGTYYAIKWVVEVIGNIYDNPELLEVEE